MLTGRASCFFQRGGVFKVAMALLMGLLAVALPAPRAAAQDMVHMDAFVNVGGTVSHSWTFDGENWAGWHALRPLPKGTISNPAAIALGWGREDVFLVCGGYYVCHNWFDGNTGHDWGEWEVLPGPGPLLNGLADMSASAILEGNMGAELFVVDNWLNVWHGTYTKDGGITWDAQKLRCGPVARQSGVNASARILYNGKYLIKLEAYQQDTSYLLYLWWNKEDGATDWMVDRSIRVLSPPEQTPDRVDASFAYVRPDYRMQWLDYKSTVPGAPQTWYQFGAVCPAPLRIDIVVAPRYGDGVYYVTFKNGAWGAWREIPGLSRDQDASRTDVISWTTP